MQITSAKLFLYRQFYKKIFNSKLIHLMIYTYTEESRTMNTSGCKIIEIRDRDI